MVKNVYNRMFPEGVFCSACLVASLFILLPVQAASFDCAKASTKVEKMICDDAQLSQQDNELSREYIQVLARNEDQKEVIQNQKLWLKEVRNSCFDAACLKMVYAERIFSLISNQWSKGTRMHGTAFPTSVCTKEQPLEYCSLSQAKLIVREQEIIDDAANKISKIIIPNLNKTNFVRDVGVDNDINKKIESYCSEKLSALREGHIKLFPQPQAKSSQVGFQMLNQRREVKLKEQSCDKGRGLYAMLNTYNISDTEWLYEYPDGLARLFINHKDGAVSLTATFDQCNAVVGLADLIASRTDAIGSGAGFFTEQAFGFVKIEGELFGIEGGVMVMDGDAYHWKDSAYFSVWDKTYDMSKDAVNETWNVRILSLFPLSSRWAKFYHHMNLNNKACMWTIQK